MEVKDMRLGILGIGGFGRFCLEQYRMMPGVRVAGIAGTNPDKYARLAREYAIPFFTTEWRQLVEHPDMDIIYLATPPHLHAEQAMAALDAGKHVFCEKPLALSLPEADAMLATAERHSVRLGINFVMRYSALYDLVRSVTRQDLLGAPLRFTFANSARDLPAAHWFWDRARSGGIPVEHGVHFFDIFSSIFGPGKPCWATSSRRPSGEEDRWLMEFEYAQRVSGLFSHAFDRPDALEETWVGIEYERGRLILDGWIPYRLTLDALTTERETTPITNLIPGAAASVLETPGPVLSNGKAFPASRHIRGTIEMESKTAVYAQAVRDAMADFLAWTRNPAYCPRVTAREGRDALAVARKVTELAHA